MGSGGRVMVVVGASGGDGDVFCAKVVLVKSSIFDLTVLIRQDADCLYSVDLFRPFGLKFDGLFFYYNNVDYE